MGSFELGFSLVKQYISPSFSLFCYDFVIFVSYKQSMPTKKLVSAPTNWKIAPIPDILFINKKQVSLRGNSDPQRSETERSI